MAKDEMKNKLNLKNITKRNTDQIKENVGKSFDIKLLLFFYYSLFLSIFNILFLFYAGGHTQNSLTEYKYYNTLHFPTKTFSLNNVIICGTELWKGHLINCWFVFFITTMDFFSVPGFPSIGVMKKFYINERFIFQVLNSQNHDAYPLLLNR